MIGLNVLSRPRNSRSTTLEAIITTMDSGTSHQRCPAPPAHSPVTAVILLRITALAIDHTEITSARAKQAWTICRRLSAIDSAKDNPNKGLALLFDTGLYSRSPSSVYGSDRLSSRDTGIRSNRTVLTWFLFFSFFTCSMFKRGAGFGSFSS